MLFSLGSLPQLMSSSSFEIPGQMNAAERQILAAAIRDAPTAPKIVLEVGTWFGGGSTLHLLRALEENGEGHLWGIEADRTIYDQMLGNICSAAPDAAARFTPLFGLSHEVIPHWLQQLGPDAKVDLVFLDGGDNPNEQIQEFELLSDRIPVGGHLFAHDAKLRKGKWLLPYLKLLDNWRVQLHDVSVEGLLGARKLRAAPTDASRNAAKQALKKLRREPVEVLGRWLPAPVCALILRLLPIKLRNRVSQGR
jgi:predicted O-methyltransferase YrrM